MVAQGSSTLPILVVFPTISSPKRKVCIMAKFDIRKALVNAGRTGDAPQVFRVKDGKKTIGSFKLHGRKAMQATTYSQLKSCVKEEDEISGSIAGEKIVEGKVESASRKEFWYADQLTEILDAHVGVKEEPVKEEVKDGVKPDPIQQRANGQKPAIAPAKP